MIFPTITICSAYIFCRPMKSNLIVVLLLCACTSAEGQYKADTSHPPLSFDQHLLDPVQDHPARKTYWNWVVPGSMILYGFVCLHVDPITDWNEEVKDEIWTEDPHKLNHMDNYLQFAPALAVYGLNLAGVRGEHNLLDRP